MYYEMQNIHCIQNKHFLAFPSGNVQLKFRPDLQRPCWCSRWSEECGVTELWLRDAILSPLKKTEIQCTESGNQLVCTREECGRSHILQTAGWTASYVSHLSESSAVSTLSLQLGSPRLTGLTSGYYCCDKTRRPKQVGKERVCLADTSTALFINKGSQGRTSSQELM